MHENNYDLIIIGGGPGGMSAAIYAGRSHLRTLLIDKQTLGGQIVDSMNINNYPGFTNLSGAELMHHFETHLCGLHTVTIMTARVTGITTDGDGHTIHTKRKGDLHTHAVILATGAQPRRLGIPGEDDFKGSGVSYCSTCDAPFYQGKDVVVLGAGNQAIENALLLTHYANSVTVAVIHGENELDCNAADREAALTNAHINFIWNSTISAIHGDDVVKSVTVHNVLSGANNEMQTSAVFSFVGMSPQTDLLPSTVTRTDNGAIAVDQYQQTSIPGVYAIGDCTNSPVHQVITAASDGARAAVAAERYVAEVQAISSLSDASVEHKAVLFYSPYDTTSVQQLSQLRAVLPKDYQVMLVDTSKQQILFHQLELHSPLAVAIYHHGRRIAAQNLYEDAQVHLKALTHTSKPQPSIN